MMHILSAESITDSAEWLKALGRLPPQRRDLHFEPGYVRAYARSQMAEGRCLLYSKESTLVIQPFVQHGDEMMIAYGYGGPITALDSLWFCEYENELEAWMRKNGIVRENTRLHPLIWQHSPPDLKQQKLIVFMDLTLEEPLSELRKGHRHALGLADRTDVIVSESEDLDLFMHLYSGMLARRAAEDKWRIRRSLLEQLAAAYPGNGFQMLIAGTKCAAPQVACILLGAHDTCYYHYAASSSLPTDGAGHLLVAVAAKWAKARGYKRLHLGGGLTDDPQDSLLGFKAGFSKRRAWCYVYTRTVNGG